MNGMEIAILICIILTLSIYHYLNYFYAKKTLPYRFGFLQWVMFQHILVLANSIIFLNWLYGVLIFVGLFFLGNYICFPMVFILHSITGTYRKMKMYYVGQPNMILYTCWVVLIVPILVTLTVINFFTKL